MPPCGRRSSVVRGAVKILQYEEPPMGGDSAEARLEEVKAVLLQLNDVFAERV